MTSSPPAVVQPLESRQMLTTLFVTSLTETVSDRLGIPDGLISLQEAVNAVNLDVTFGDAAGANVTNIEFAAGLIGAGATVSLDEALEIDADVTINGNNADVTIDAGGLDRCFIINAGVEVTLNMLTLRNGVAQAGGLVQVNENAKLRLTNSVLEDGVSLGDGGALQALANSTLTVVDSVIRGNTAGGTGGAIHLRDGNHTFVGVTFGGEGVGDGNEAGTSGGAISKQGDGVLTVNGTDIVGNTAGTSGGGIFLSGEGAMTPPTLKMRSGSVVAGNVVTSATAGAGGGIATAEASLDLAGVTVEGNVVQGSSALGGGLYAKDSTGTLASIRVGGNALPGLGGMGGGVSISGGGLTFSASTIGSFDNDGTMVDGNSVDPTGCGGGMHIDNAELIYGGGEIRDNNGGARGGGICAVGVNSTVKNGTVIENNTAADGGGIWASMTGVLTLGTLTISDNSAGDDGGGLFLNSGRLVSVGTTYSGNRADDDGGGIYSEATESMFLADIDLGGMTGNTANNGGGLFRATGGGRVTVGGGQIRNNAAAVAGGGLALNAGGLNLIRNNVSFSGNTASGTGSAGGGGAIYANGTVVSVQQTDFTGNTSAGRGGAIYQQASRLGVINSTFTQNTGDSGGAIFAADLPLVVANSTFGGATRDLGNVATGDGGLGGGAISATGQGSRVTVSNAAFQNNTALAGGGLAIHDATLVMRNNSRVIDNAVATGVGGGLFLNGGTSTVQQTLIEGNQAGRTEATDSGFGGGVYVSGGEATFVATTVSGNVAANSGGGIGVSGGTLALYGTTIGGASTEAGNRVESLNGTLLRGGGISVENGSNAKFVNTVVQNNVAAHKGGGV